MFLILIVTAIVAFLPLTASTNNIPEACKQVMRNHETENVHSEITIYGITRRLEVQWGSGATNLANAALLLVVLKYVHGYKDAVLVKGSETLCELASDLPNRVEDDDSYKLVIHVGAKPPENNLDCPALYSCDDPRDLCTMAGRNLNIMGEAMPPIGPQLHIQTHEATCQKKTWRYDSSQTDLKKCNFFSLSDLKIPKLHEENNPTLSNFLNEYRNPNCLYKNNTVKFNCTLVLLDLDLNNTNNKESTKRIAKEIEHYKLKFQLIPKSAASLRLTISDYSLFSLHLPAHPRPAYRVAPGNLLQQFAYRILYVVRRFAPAPDDIKKILDIIPISDYENSMQDMENATCQYFAENAYNFIDWACTSDFVPWIHVLLCKGDPDNEWYKHISGEVANTVHTIFTNFTRINCSDENDFNQEMFKRSRNMRWAHMIGMVGRGAGAALAAQAARSMETQVVLYDVPSDTAILSGSMRTATGKVKPLTLALKHFFKQNGWRRIAIISDRNKLSVDFNKTLCDDNQALYHRERIIDSENSKTSAKEILQQFSKDSAPGHIFFLNTDTTAAGELLCAAISLGMTDRKGYAWIVREWGSPPPPCNVTDIRHFTVTYWWRGGDESNLEEKEKEMQADPILHDLREKINEKSKKYKKTVWPPLTAPLVDAIMLLFYEYNVTLKSYPGLRYNLHGGGIAKNISETFTEETEVPGIAQTLKQKDYSQESPLVFLYAWRGNSNGELLAVWKVENETVKVVSEVKETYPVPGEPAPKDGSRACLFPTGDSYDPTCHDVPISSGVTLVAIILILGYFGHRYWIKKWMLREHMMQMRMLARSERRAVTLGPYLVSRSSLDTREELGTGNFGRVHFGMLTFPKQKIPVAVKSLREEASLAEESQFLHEACILSRLSHVNIVRLIGVCAADGPPLMMMEHAFFRDLCVYLRARRHYAEIEDNEMDEQEIKEASFISPLALTQLAREAASALDYLCFKKIVHRDVRAANCLVDGSRTLKLADFGMAREMTSSKTLKQVNSLAPSNGKTNESASFTTISEPVNYSYFCKRRRDKFPLSWMAPESVSRGEFSSATDVWSLGVMMFEIVTLGQRPFGSWSLQRVYDYLFNGGIPELPLEISYNSREVIEMCWWKEPSKRATAAAIRTHLAANPTALRHAVGRKPTEERSPNNRDSVYCERTGLLTSDDPRISTY